MLVALIVVATTSLCHGVPTLSFSQVLGKFPVIQHFLFGKILSLEPAQQ